MSMFYIVFCNITLLLTCKYIQNEKKKASLVLKYFWEYFGIISASLINVNGNHTLI